jgi:hypothetical protein
MALFDRKKRSVINPNERAVGIQTVMATRNESVPFTVEC